MVLCTGSCPFSHLSTGRHFTCLMSTEVVESALSFIIHFVCSGSHDVFPHLEYCKFLLDLHKIGTDTHYYLSLSFTTYVWSNH